METLNQFMLEYPGLMYSGVGATAFVAGGALIYKFATRKKPIHANVNCWFCNKNTVVPYGNRNCWDCPYCDQYNGFQENGDYNKPIPAQYNEHLNHGVSASLPSSEAPKTLQWVNCQMLLCRKCNNNQTKKIKQLASFIPRDDESYDEEIEAYKHHLEQTYKLCRPCQAAVEYYIKYQNRQLRPVLLNHQLHRSRESSKAFVKSSYSTSSPISVVLLRLLAFLVCAFLLASSFYEVEVQAPSAAEPQTLSGGIIPPKPKPYNESTAEDEGVADEPLWQSLLELIPDEVVEKAKTALKFGRDSPLAVVSVGLLTCLTAIFLAGPARLRRIDAVASVLWFFILCLHLTQSFFFSTVASDWIHSAKVGGVSFCCLVSFAAAVATRKSPGLRRARYRRYVADGFSSQHPLLCSDQTDSFVLTPPPNISRLINQHQQSPRESKASLSTLPGRLSRALSLGTIPSLNRTGGRGYNDNPLLCSSSSASSSLPLWSFFADAGSLFSGSRTPSLYKDSPPSDYFSLISGSRPSSPGPSPTPSVAGSVTSSSGSARHRRPLISPARLHLSGQKIPKTRLFCGEAESTVRTPPVSPSHFHAELASSAGRGFFPSDSSLFHSHNDLTSLFRDGSVIEEEEKRSDSSHSSACLVGTTTPVPEAPPPRKGFGRRLLWSGLLLLSVSVNVLFVSLYVYQNCTRPADGSAFLLCSH